ncbi:hypothetical protein Taro_052869 [Colocasia esculenta]|uniref:DSBA-like thioredoxin domain-containing protein n=1 Tax=Colocasia esculenta TaxID=4460 RepID=A0A843XLG8_COLES|nr:hypothetical protein [Colocasia esculenta]
MTLNLVSLVPSPNAVWRRSFSVPRCISFMSQSNHNANKALIQIDVVSDTVCPWCFVGKKNLDKAIDMSKDRFDFEVRWHPFLLSPDAPKEGLKKSDFFRQKFGHQYERITSRMREVSISSDSGILEASNMQVFQGLGYEYDLSGLWGSTLDSHRLITFAGKQGFDKQDSLVEELFINYFTEGKYINDREGPTKKDVTINHSTGFKYFDVIVAYGSIRSPCRPLLLQICSFKFFEYRGRQVLLEAARKAGVECAEELLEDPNKGLKEVQEELERYSSDISGVPHYVINGKRHLSGGQPPQVFLRAFEAVAK